MKSEPTKPAAVKPAQGGSGTSAAPSKPATAPAVNGQAPPATTAAKGPETPPTPSTQTPPNPSPPATPTPVVTQPKAAKPKEVEPPSMGDWIGETEKPGSPWVKHSTIDEAKLHIWWECPYLQKRKSEGVKYTFANEADLIGKVRPSLLRHGVTLRLISTEVVKDEQYTTKKGGEMRRVVVKNTYRFKHVWSQQEEDVPMFGEAADYGDKAMGKANTMALKYALRQWLFIETGDDPDFVPPEESQPAGPAKKPDANDPNAGPPAAKPPGQKPPGQKTPEQKRDESFSIAKQAVVKATSQEQLDAFRVVYRNGTRRYTSDQVDALEALYKKRGHELKAAAAKKLADDAAKAAADAAKAAGEDLAAGEIPNEETDYDGGFPTEYNEDEPPTD